MILPDGAEVANYADLLEHLASKSCRSLFDRLQDHPSYKENFTEQAIPISYSHINDHLIGAAVRPSHQPIQAPPRVPRPDISDNSTPRLFALFIGINKYANVTSLKGAVADAQRMKDYMKRTLKPPDDQIRVLLDNEASRDNIISELKALANNQSIQCGDAILIYYAGHGALITAPTGWPSGRPDQKIQSIVPQNFCKGKIDVIPDRTIGNLIDMIEEKHGNNITVIFDCCHSGSGTRNDDDTIRSAGLENYSISPNLDEDIRKSGTEARGIASATGQAASGLESHIFLSACSANELAREDSINGHGYFTTALLKLLNMTSPDQLTYDEVLERLESIPGQNPQLEGKHRRRIFFNAQAASPYRSHHSIHYNHGRGFVMKAGMAHGICLGAQFTVYENKDQLLVGPGLGVLDVISVSPFDSVLAVLPGHNSFALLAPAVAIQTKAGGDQELKLYVPFEQGYLCIFQAVLLHMQRAGPDLGTIVLVENCLVSHLATVLQDEKITFNVSDPHMRGDAMLHMSHTVSPRVEDVLDVLEAAVHYMYHLRRTPKNDLVAEHVAVQLFKLERSKALTNEATGGHVLLPSEKNLIMENQVSLNVCEHLSPDYGFCINNNSTQDLFPNIFYFNDSDLSIEPIFMTGASPVETDSPLLKGGKLTLGYGAGGVLPLEFDITTPGQNFETGYLKIFLSSKAIDLSHVPHPPFNTRASRWMEVANPRANFWGSIQVPVYMTRCCDCSLQDHSNEYCINHDSE